MDIKDFAEENKANYLRFNAVIPNGNLEDLSQFLAANFVFHYFPEVKGIDAMKQFFAGYRAAFSNWNPKIDYIFAEGDMVAVFYTENGVFSGELRGIAPTGKAFSLPWVNLVRYEGGKQVEAWPYSDHTSWFRQVGITIPAG